MNPHPQILHHTHCTVNPKLRRKSSPVDSKRDVTQEVGAQVNLGLMEMKTGDHDLDSKVEFAMNQF